MFNHRLKIKRAAEKEARRQAGIDKRRGPRKTNSKWDKIYEALKET
tara:strand:- start:245 stop:382 length:138 start_codon:yes stop_codon:yes gene_type:complete